MHASASRQSANANHLLTTEVRTHRTAPLNKVRALLSPVCISLYNDRLRIDRISQRWPKKGDRMFGTQLLCALDPLCILGKHRRVEMPNTKLYKLNNSFTRSRRDWLLCEIS